MEAVDLRPLSLGELLDRTFSIYRANFWLFVGIMAIPSAFSIPFSIVFMSARTSPAFGGRPTSAMPGASVLLFVGISVLFAWTAYSLAIGAVMYAVSETYLGRKVTGAWFVWQGPGQILEDCRGHLSCLAASRGVLILVGGGSLIVGGMISIPLGLALRGLGTVVPIVIGVLIFLCYVAGIVLWLCWSLRFAVCIPALLLERLGVTAAIRRSVQLTNGRRWQIFVAVILCAMIAYVGVIVFQGPFMAAMIFTARAGQQPEWLVFVSSVFGAIGASITGSLLMIVLVLCYYDTRIRKEAFDLQFMMSEARSAGSRAERGHGISGLRLHPSCEPPRGSLASHSYCLAELFWRRFSPCLRTRRHQRQISR